MPRQGRRVPRDTGLGIDTGWTREPRVREFFSVQLHRRAHSEGELLPEIDHVRSPRATGNMALAGD